MPIPDWKNPIPADQEEHYNNVVKTFLLNTPGYVATPDNAEQLLNWIAERDMDVTESSLATAYRCLFNPSHKGLNEYNTQMQEVMNQQWANKASQGNVGISSGLSGSGHFQSIGNPSIHWKEKLDLLDEGMLQDLTERVSIPLKPKPKERDPIQIVEVEYGRKLKDID